MYFDEAIEHLMSQEGSFSNDPSDRGGATNFGITIDVLRSYRGNYQLTLQDVKNLSLNEAKQIYRALYWNPLKLDQCKHRFASIAIFDQCVNRGLHGAVKDVQTACEKGLLLDGVMGEKTMDAVNTTDESSFLINFACASQISYARIVTSSPDQLRFLRGWLKRTHQFLYMSKKPSQSMIP
jgi:lysozyme family protein